MPQTAIRVSSIYNNNIITMLRDIMGYATARTPPLPFSATSPSGSARPALPSPAPRGIRQRRASRPATPPGARTRAGRAPAPHAIHALFPPSSSPPLSQLSSLCRQRSPLLVALLLHQSSTATSSGPPCSILSSSDFIHRMEQAARSACVAALCRSPSLQFLAQINQQHSSMPPCPLRSISPSCLSSLAALVDPLSLIFLCSFFIHRKNKLLLSANKQTLAAATPVAISLPFSPSCRLCRKQTRAPNSLLAAARSRHAFPRRQPSPSCVADRLLRLSSVQSEAT